MTPSDPSDGMAPIVEATAELRGMGNEPAVIGRLLLNGAAVVLHEGCTEAEFLEIARQMWRAKERQVELCSLLDRVEGSREFRGRTGKRRASEGRRRPASELEAVKGVGP